jgi:FKBP-type peptidyl-prolyl cis-trans isomerase FkpA
LKIVKKMKRILLAVLVVSVMISCSKKYECNYNGCDYPAVAAEITALQGHITTNGINAEKDCSGVFYTILEQGTGEWFDACSDVTVSYKGMRLSDNFIFDQTVDASTGQEFYRRFNLGGLIAGWRSTLTKIKRGGKIRLYIPPSLGYGNQAQPNIPANSYLIFEIKVAP